MGANPLIFISMGPGCNLLERTVFPVEKICMVRGERSNRKQTLVCFLEAEGFSSAVIQLHNLERVISSASALAGVPLCCSCPLTSVMQPQGGGLETEEGKSVRLEHHLAAQDGPRRKACMEDWCYICCCYSPLHHRSLVQ